MAVFSYVCLHPQPSRGGTLTAPGWSGLLHSVKTIHSNQVWGLTPTAALGHKPVREPIHVQGQGYTDWPTPGSHGSLELMRVTLTPNSCTQKKVEMDTRRKNQSLLTGRGNGYQTGKPLTAMQPPKCPDQQRTGLAPAGLWEMAMHASHKCHVQGHHIRSVKAATKGVFTPRDWQALHPRPLIFPDNWLLHIC